MYWIMLIKTIPKPIRILSILYLLVLLLLEVSVSLHSKLLASTVYRVLFVTSFIGVLFTVISITLMADIQRKDTVVDEIKCEVVRLYVKYRPEAENDAELREIRWDLMTKSVNEYVQKNVNDVDQNYKRILKFEKKDIKEIFTDYMNYISRKILREYRTVELDSLDTLDPWDKLLFGVRNMYLEDLKRSFGENSKEVESHVL